MGSPSGASFISVTSAPGMTPISRKCCRSAPSPPMGVSPGRTEGSHRPRTASSFGASVRARRKARTGWFMCMPTRRKAVSCIRVPSSMAVRARLPRPSIHRGSSPGRWLDSMLSRRRASRAMPPTVHRAAKLSSSTAWAQVP